MAFPFTGALHTLEVWAEYDDTCIVAMRAWAGVELASGTFRAWTSDNRASIEELLAAVASEKDPLGYSIPEGTRGWTRRSDDWSLSLAMKRVMMRQIRFALGGEPNWRPVYNGPLATALPHVGFDATVPSDKPKTAPTVPDPSDNQFAGLTGLALIRAQRLAVLNQRTVIAKVKKVEAARAEAGIVEVRAYHKNAPPVLCSVPVTASIDGTTINATLVKNNPLYATIQASTSDSFGSSPVAWFWGTILVGVSEPQGSDNE